jgi:hypothetical protein
MRLPGVTPQARIATKHANIAACVDTSKIFSFITKLKNAFKWQFEWTVVLQKAEA